MEALKWYNDVNSDLLNYVSTTISEADFSDFHRYIIGFKDLVRSVEYSGKAGVLGIR